MKSAKLELVNGAYTLVILPNNGNVAFKINQALLDNDPTQIEALLQPHQVRAFGVIVDNLASRRLNPSGSPGTQCIKVGDRTSPMSFDGWTHYYKLEKLTANDLVKF